MLQVEGNSVPYFVLVTQISTANHIIVSFVGCRYSHRRQIMLIPTHTRQMALYPSKWQILLFYDKARNPPLPLYNNTILTFFEF